MAKFDYISAQQDALDLINEFGIEIKFAVLVG